MPALESNLLFTQKESFNLTQISQIFCPAEIAEIAEMGFAQPCGMIPIDIRISEK
jgi:hypothetical protein